MAKKEITSVDTVNSITAQNNIFINNGQLKQTPVSNLIKLLGLTYKTGDSVSLRGNYGGNLTTSNKNIIFSIPLPKEIDSNVTTATLKATVAVRCNGAYLLNNASVTLSATLDASARQCGNIVFTYISDTSLGGTNNTAVDVWVGSGSTLTFS